MHLLKKPALHCFALDLLESLLLANSSTMAVGNVCVATSTFTLRTGQIVYIRII